MSITAQQIIESIPARFRPEKAAGVQITFHFSLSGNQPLQYTVLIANGTCQLQQGLNGTPDCLLSTKAETYVDLETGKANPQMALMMGKVKLSNLAVMMQFAKCFRKFDAAEASSESAKPITTLQRPVKTGPLKGVKVIDFTRLLPGPLATMFLADMGADVIKVEDPDSPDYIRDFEPRRNGVAFMYLALNRNKRSLGINYRSAEGKALLYDLIKTADVLVEQYRPGVMNDLGFGYEAVKQLNPKLIYVSVTGYGQQSTMAAAAGHDLNYVALSGNLGITGVKNGAPVIPGFQLADIAGGAYMAMNAVTAALYQREKTGKGEWIDVAMTDCVVPFTVLQHALYQATGKNPGRAGYELNGALANYNVYACADGKYIALGSLEPKFWNVFCKRAGRTDWPERFLKEEELGALKAEVQQFFSAKNREEWLAFFAEDDICLTPVNELEDLDTDPYLQSRNMFIENEHPSVGKYKTINQPLKFKDSNFENNWSAPELGADSASILKELNYTDSRIQQLQQTRIIKTTP
ncbi:MAG: CoA transferase [Chitinophagales bacterium]